MDRHPNPQVAPRDGRQTQARFVPTDAAVA